MPQLILTPLQSIPLVVEGDSIPQITLSGCAKNGIQIQDGDVFVFAQKVISKAEGRFVDLHCVSPSQTASEIAAEVNKDPALIELILQESNQVLRKREGVIIVEHRLGFVCANAGIDRSNVRGPAGKESGDEEWVLLLPHNPDDSAEQIRKEIAEATGKNIGVLIIDSHGRAWRLGTSGVVIGTANVPLLEDLRGHEDLFGYELTSTDVGVGDELAAAASLMMGQKEEGTPIVHVRGLPYPLRQSQLGEILRPKEKDLFR